MREAVIVSTARTAIGKAYRGAFNNLEGPTLASHAIRTAVARARLDPAEIDDVVMGAAVQQGTQGYNIGRQCAIAAGLPVTVSGMSVDRQCASGLMAIATAAKAVVVDGMPIVVGGGLESISLVQNEHRNSFRTADPTVMARKPELYMAMLDTAEVVAERYGVSRERADSYPGVHADDNTLRYRHRRPVHRRGKTPAALASGAAVPANIAKGPVYILNGYSFQDMKGVNPSELEPQNDRGRIHWHPKCVMRCDEISFKL